MYIKELREWAENEAKKHIKGKFKNCIGREKKRVNERDWDVFKNGMDEVFPVRRLNDRSHAKRRKTDDDEAVDQIAQLQYCLKEPNGGPKNPHFRSKSIDLDDEKRLVLDDILINPVWVEYHFDPVFYYMCKYTPGIWWPVPVGNCNSNYAPEEILSNHPIRYTQGNCNLCMMYSMASALDYLSLDNQHHKKIRDLFQETGHVISTQNWVPGTTVQQNIHQISQIMKKYCYPIAEYVTYNKQPKRG